MAEGCTNSLNLANGEWSKRSSGKFALENLCHLFAALDVVLVAVVTHAVFIGDHFPGADAEQDVVSFVVIGIEVVAVVGRNDRQTKLLGDVIERIENLLLLRQAVILQFNEEVFFTENVA